MDTVTSRDGTPIAFDLAGSGTPIVFVTGAFNDHTACAELAAALADDFTVLSYDRRARGASGDTPPYRIDREVDDLSALIDKVGGSAAVFGYSSGGVLALRAAADGAPITHLALFEAPFAYDGAARRADLPARLADLVGQGRPGDAVALFQTEGIGLPAEVVAQIRTSPMFAALAAIAQSTVYDATITTELALPSPAMTAVSTPTLVLNGAQTWPALRASAVSLAAALPAGRHVELPGGADHRIPTAATAAALRDFFRT
jgi:alpha-beta hydrolase superfamily lysophospholipase